MVVEPIKDKKLIERFLTQLRGTNYRNWILAKFQLNTGLRISDVVRINTSDIFTDTMRFKDYLVIKEKKTNKEKKIRLNDELRKAIKDYVRGNDLNIGDYLFQSRKGENKYISTTQAYRILKEAADAVGLENFASHSLRKTWGYWTYKASRYNIGLIMDMFNHASEKVTLRYIGISQEAKDELYSLVQF
ncbi:tyrosine-type recombinase/integrase [Candidatus Clostridium radicumherbarum]|uniref:Tyrosine-type recombinase/integrase n=1 Tax=Candidatus Clostridium radicumherbarum TaxID=3381662 RepID=A0ABW8TYB4_9CLOT